MKIGIILINKWSIWGLVGLRLSNEYLLDNGFKLRFVIFKSNVLDVYF